VQEDSEPATNFCATCFFGRAFAEAENQDHRPRTIIGELSRRETTKNASHGGT
jgi:hypothetical protein